jgi:hypothetical protein
MSFNTGPGIINFDGGVTALIEGEEEQAGLKASNASQRLNLKQGESINDSSRQRFMESELRVPLHNCLSKQNNEIPYFVQHCFTNHSVEPQNGFEKNFGQGNSSSINNNFHKSRLNKPRFLIAKRTEQTAKKAAGKAYQGAKKELAKKIKLTLKAA